MGNAAKQLTGWVSRLVFFTLLSGCAGGFYTDDYDTYLDANGDVVRAYAAPFDQAIESGIEALADVGGTVSSRSIEGHETIVRARAMDGSPIILRFTREGRNLTVVRVRTGLLGHVNREYSSQLHAYLAARLKHPGVLRAGPPEPSPSVAAPAAESNARQPSGAAVKTTRTEPAVPSVKRQEELPADEPPAGTAKTGTFPPSNSNSSEPFPPASGDDAPPDVARLTPPTQPHPDYVIFFEKDSNIPSSEALAILDQAAEMIQTHPDAAVDISGHADPDEDPQELHLVSESRAIAVKSYLIGKGIPPGRIRTAWHGSDFARFASDDKSQLRRVEIRLARGL